MTFCSEWSWTPSLYESSLPETVGFVFFKAYRCKLFELQEHTFVRTLPASGKQEQNNQKCISAKFVKGSLLISRARVEFTIVFLFPISLFCHPSSMETIFKKCCFHVNEQPKTEDANEWTGPHPSSSRIFINRWSKLPNKWPMTPPTPFLTPLSALVIVILVSITCGELAAPVCSTFRYSVQIFLGVFKGDIGCPKW